MSDRKILIAYYSYSGNTKSIAEKIQKITGGDIFEIKSVKEYPRNYTDIVNLAKKEKEENFKPELVEDTDISGYDTIFLGSPVWWYTFASPVRTFIANHDFSQKTILPFCTHGGGGALTTFKEVQELCTGADIKEGLASFENMIKDEDVRKWVEASLS